MTIGLLVVNASLMMISEHILKEGDLLLCSFLLGIILTFAYDLLRVTRRLFPHGKWGIALEDLLFWTASALCIFIMFYRKNDGSLRGFALLGLVPGMALYGKLLSPYVVKVLAFLLGKLFHLLFFPFVKMNRCLRISFNKFVRFVKKLLKKNRKIVTMLLKRCGFGRQRNRKHGNKKRVSKDSGRAGKG